jgi:hypothetical protein
MVFLHSDGVGTARAVRIFKTYGADTVQVMTENPIGLPEIFEASVSRAPMRSRGRKESGRLWLAHNARTVTILGDELLAGTLQFSLNRISEELLLR